MIKRSHNIIPLSPCLLPSPQMDVEPRIAVLQDLRLQSFDLIRFASYRTASKLRYIQKSTNRKWLTSGLSPSLTDPLCPFQYTCWTSGT